jgi:hypothetical protein
LGHAGANGAVATRISIPKRNRSFARLPQVYAVAQVIDRIRCPHELTMRSNANEPARRQQGHCRALVHLVALPASTGRKMHFTGTTVLSEQRQDRRGDRPRRRRDRADPARPDQGCMIKEQPATRIPNGNLAAGRPARPPVGASFCLRGRGRESGGAARHSPRSLD